MEFELELKSLILDIWYKHHTVVLISPLVSALGCHVASKGEGLGECVMSLYDFFKIFTYTFTCTNKFQANWSLPFYSDSDKQYKDINEQMKMLETRLQKVWELVILGGFSCSSPPSFAKTMLSACHVYFLHRCIM